jgi:hypothetical protein
MSPRAALAPGGFVKKIQQLTFLATLAIGIGMISWGSALHAQTTPSSPADQQTPQTAPSQTPSPEMPPQAQQTPSAAAPNSQQPSSQAPDTSTPESGSKSSTPSGATATGTDAQTFSGTVSKQGDKYVLKDDSGQTYDIDHQAEVAKFDGKRVRVQGTLDPTGKKIMVK